jgi:CheY-like chemotaxis protein
LEEAALDQIEITETPSFTAGLERLREQDYDVVLLDQDTSRRPAAELIAAIQAGTRPDQAVVVLADGDDRLLAADFLLAGANAYLSLRSTTTRELVCQLQRAARLSQLQAENRRLHSWQQRSGERDQEEVLDCLQEEERLIAQFATSSGITEFERPPTGRQNCGELLQAYVVMGRGGLDDEVRRLVVGWRAQDRPLAALLADFNAAHHALVQDRGGRSARHVLHRGNLLLLELLLSWTEHAGGAR